MKKYVVSVIIIIVLWFILWQCLGEYDNKFPNKSITEFSKSVFNDLGTIEIVKNNEESNLFEVCENGNKLIQVVALKNDEDWDVTLKKQYIEPINIYVPKDSLVYIGDDLVNKNNLVKYEPIDRYSLLDDKELLPNIDCYVIKNYIDIPDIRVINREKECSLEIADRIVTASLDISLNEKEEIKNVLLNTSKLYARYITNDANFSELSDFLYKNTDFYKEIRNFYNDWYAHDGYEFRDVKVLDLRLVADNAFYGDVSFEYILKKGKKEFSFPSKYQIYFIKSLNNWKAICIDTK